jgi:chromosome segregation ATPase
MPTNRSNPNDGLLDLFHTDTNTWVRAIALLQIAGGLNVKLTGDQEDLLAAIGVDVQKLQTLLAEVQGVRTGLTGLTTITDNVRSNLQNNITPAITGLSGDLADIQVIETNVLSKLDATRLLISDVTNATLTDIASRTVNYSTALGSVNTSLAAINTKTIDFTTQWGTNNTTLSSIDTRLTAANLTLTSLDTRLTTTNTTLTSVDTRLTTANTTLSSVDTRLSSANTNLTLISNTATSIDGRVTTVNTNLTSIDGRLTTANTTLSSIDTRLTTVNTNLTNIQTSINNLRPSAVNIATAVLTAADTQVSYSVPSNTKRLNFKVRRDASGNSYDVRYSFTAGQVANAVTGTYRTLDAYNEFSERFNNLTGATLYLASSSASAGNNITLEIEALT